MTTRQRKPVSKALQALYWLVEMSQPEIGVRQLAAAMNIAPSSAHRVLATLADVWFRQPRHQISALCSDA